MAGTRKNSSLLSKYTLMYQKKPQSRVFAPLAETYRKLGMVDEAINILQKGIRIHPTYTLGYIVLANCYYDLQNFELAYNTIRSFVPGNLENLSLQKLFAKTCMQLGYLDEALVTYKNLLLLNPKDMFVADQVKLLEDDLLINQEEELEPEAINNPTSFDEDNWIQVDFGKTESSQAKEDEIEWEVQDPIAKFKKEVWEEKLEVAKRSLDDEFFYEDYDNSSEDVITPEIEEETPEEDGPIITHTLVDLYCSQGHFDKAQEILNDILKLHPNDKATQKRLAEVEQLIASNDEGGPEAEEEVSGEIESAQSEKKQLIEKRYKSYLAKLQSHRQAEL